MTCRNRKLADERGKGWIQDGPLNLLASNRIRTIADDYLLPQFLGRAHAIRHGIYERIDSSANILQVKDDHIDIPEHLFSGLARFAIQRIDREAGLAIVRVRRLHHIVLNIAPDS